MSLYCPIGVDESSDLTRTKTQAVYRILWYSFVAFFLLDCIDFIVTEEIVLGIYTGTSAFLLLIVPLAWPGWWKRRTGTSNRPNINTS